MSGNHPRFVGISRYFDCIGRNLERCNGRSPPMLAQCRPNLRWYRAFDPVSGKWACKQNPGFRTSRCQVLPMTAEQTLSFLVLRRHDDLLHLGSLSLRHHRLLGVDAFGSRCGIVPFDNAFDGFSDDIVIIVAGIDRQRGVARSGCVDRPSSDFFRTAIGKGTARLRRHGHGPFASSRTSARLRS